MFDASDLDGAMFQIEECRKAFPENYIKVNGYDRTKGKQTTMLSFIVHRPAEEPGFYLERTEGADRQVQYTIRSNAKVAV